MIRPSPFIGCCSFFNQLRALDADQRMNQVMRAYFFRPLMDELDPVYILLSNVCVVCL
jgi:hypothetical protein